MKEKMNMDARLESVLQQDAAGIAKLTPEVPESLRARIAGTPSAAATSTSFTTVAVKFFTTKFMLASIGGMIVLAMVYFALNTEETPVSQPQSNPPSAVIEIDTPRQDDTLTRQAVRSGASDNATETKQISPTQEDVNSILDNLPEPESRMSSSDSIHGKVRRNR